MPNSARLVILMTHGFALITLARNDVGEQVKCEYYMEYKQPETAI